MPHGSLAIFSTSAPQNPTARPHAVRRIFRTFHQLLVGKTPKIYMKFDRECMKIYGKCLQMSGEEWGYIYIMIIIIIIIIILYF